MAGSGVDLIVGATRDPVFGAQVLVGLGGTVAEALGDVAVAPAPLTAGSAAQLLDRLAGRVVLDGFRGGPVVDRIRVGQVVAALGDVLVSSPGIESVEINPLRITDAGVLALDALITLTDPNRRPAARRLIMTETTAPATGAKRSVTPIAAASRGPTRVPRSTSGAAGGVGTPWAPSCGTSPMPVPTSSPSSTRTCGSPTGN